MSSSSASQSCPKKEKLEYDVTKVSATGPGLISGRTAVPAHFTLYFSDYSAIERASHPDEDIRDLLDFQFEGPSEPGPLTCSSNITDGSVDVSWTPLLRGTYNLTVLLDGKPIPGSPFKIAVEGESIRAHTLSQKVFVSFLTKGGDKKGTCRVKQENQVKINVGNPAIGGGLAVAMAGPKDAKANLKMVEDPENPKYLVTYSPTVPGTYLMYVKIAGENVPGSPFTLKAV